MKNLSSFVCAATMAITLLCYGSNAYAVGAATPFTTYEGEAGTLAGGASVVTYAPVNPGVSTAALEASGHAYVQLTGTSQSVTWTNNTGGNITALNVRFCTPDAPSGGGATSTLDLYVNGTMRQVVTFSSAQEWLYEPNGSLYGTFGGSEVPGSGLQAHMFWDETHFFITGAAVANGSTIMFKKDSTNTAAFYYIDCVDVENPPAALTQPSGSLSVTSYGAVANSPTTDNTAAFNSCFAACQSQGKIAWIPSGIFYVGYGGASDSISPNGITVEGAGMWYSEIYGNTNGVTWFPNSCTLQNFALNSSATGDENCTTGMTLTGSNWLINSIWVEHLAPAIWSGGSNGTVENCRIDSEWSDGININTSNGTFSGDNLTVTNNFVRGSGDDSIAVNEDSFNDVVTNNTTVGPRWANNMGVYGGINLVVSGNLLTDSITEQGIGLGTYNGEVILQSATVTGNTILRGGDAGGTGALDVGDGGDDEVQDVVVAGNTISNSVNSSLVVQSGWENVIANNTITSPGQNGINVDGNVLGNGVFINNTITGVPSGYSASVNNSPSTYTMITGITASAYNNSSGVSTQSCIEGGLQVATISNGSYTEYNNLNLTGMTYFQARVASAASGGDIVIHLGSATGTVIGTCPVSYTGAWHDWVTVNCPLSASATGTQNVYLVYTGGGGYLFNVEWFDFQPNIGGSTSYFPKNGAIYTLTCETSGMELDNGGSTSTGAAVVQEPFQTGDTNQEWQAFDVGNGYYNLICQKSGMALDNEGSTTAGTGLWQWTETAGDSNQEWMFLFHIENSFRILSLTSGMALDNNNSTTAGTAMVQEPQLQGSSEQRWQMAAIPQNGFIYQLRCEDSSLELDNGGSTTAGQTLVQSYNEHFSMNEMWELLSVGGGYYNVVNQTSGMAMDDGNSNTPGSPVIQWTLGGGNANQEWEPVAVGNGYYNLICMASGLTLDNGGSGSSGAAVDQQTVTSGDSNQAWAFDCTAVPQAADVSAASYNSESSVGTQSCSEGGLNVEGITNGSYTEYNSLNMSGVTGFRARVASATSGGSIVVHLDSSTGTVVGTAIGWTSRSSTTPTTSWAPRSPRRTRRWPTCARREWSRRSAPA